MMIDPPAPAPVTMSDDALIADYEQTTGEPGDARADADVAEIERRNLDV